MCSPCPVDLLPDEADEELRKVLQRAKRAVLRGSLPDRGRNPPSGHPPKTGDAVIRHPIDCGMDTQIKYLCPSFRTYIGFAGNLLVYVCLKFLARGDVVYGVPPRRLSLCWTLTLSCWLYKGKNCHLQSSFVVNPLCVITCVPTYPMWNHHASAQRTLP